VRKREDVRKKKKKQKNEGEERKKMADGLDVARVLASFSSLPLAGALPSIYPSIHLDDVIHFRF